MAGPWFTVQEGGDTWHRLDTIWISDGRNPSRAHLEIRVQLEEPKEAKQ